MNWSQTWASFVDWCQVPPLPSSWWLLGVAVIAAAGGWWWPHWATIAHEMGHAGSALLLGGRVSGIKLHSDMGGATYSRQRPLAQLVSLTAGYPAPSLAGWGLATLYVHGWSGAAVAGLAAVLLLALLMLRSAFGLITIGSALGLVALGVLVPPATAAVVAGFAVALIAGGARGIWMAWRVWHSKDGADTDAAQLRRILVITPQWAWLVGWTALWGFTVYAAATGLAGA